MKHSKVTIEFENFSENCEYGIAEGVILDIIDREEMTTKESIRITAESYIDLDMEDLIDFYQNPDMQYFLDLAETIYDCDDDLLEIARKGEYLYIVSELLANINDVCRAAIKEYLNRSKLNVEGENAEYVSNELIAAIVELVEGFQYEDRMLCFEVISNFEESLSILIKTFESKHNVKITIE